MGSLFLEWGKEKYSITDFGSDDWAELVARETKFTNMCYELFDR
jgi:hypothetical protein